MRLTLSRPQPATKTDPPAATITTQSAAREVHLTQDQVAYLGIQSGDDSTPGLDR